MRLTLALSIGLAVLAPAAAGHAQTRFADAAAHAREVDLDRFADEVGVLLSDCTNEPNAAAKRACVTGRRRAGRPLLRETFLLEMPAEGHARIGSYEQSNGGFRIYVDGFIARRATGNGVLATAPTTNGRLPTGHVAKEGFAVVPWIDAEPWLSAHAIRDLSLRMIVRIGDDFEDTGAPEVAAQYGTRLEVVGVQIYGNASGDVLVDSYAQRVPPDPSRLEDRTRIWSHTDRNEGLFVASDGTEVVLDVRLEPRSPGDTSITAILMQTVGAASMEIFRVQAPCCSSSIDLRRHGPSKILAIITEQSSEEGAVGHGRVVLLAWDAASRTFEQRAEWAGSNGSDPPAWVLDPSADP